jgi:hypothetical protein
LVPAGVPTPEDVARHIDQAHVKEQFHPFDVRHTVIICPVDIFVKNPSILPGLCNLRLTGKTFDSILVA